MNRKLLAAAVAVLIIMSSIAVVFAYNNNSDNSGGFEMTEELEQFLEICKVPRSSSNNDKIGKYLVDFADRYGLYSEMDKVGNVMIDHPGPHGGNMILQAHMDMVEAVAPGVEHDFTKDPILTEIKNGRISAKGTSLGADDGAGMAIALCALKSDELKDIGFRCIFTVDEETDFSGAMAVSKEWVDGFRYIINIDNETDDNIVVASAGSKYVYVNYTFKTEDISDRCYTLTVDNLSSGHSAADVGKNRINGILLMCEFVRSVEGARIVTLSGGTAMNVIPASASVTIAVSDGIDVKKAFEDFKNRVSQEHSESDPEMTMEFTETVMSGTCWTSESTEDFVNAIKDVPNDLLRNSEYGYITSSNIGVARIDGDIMKLTILTRSLYVDEIMGVFHEIQGIFSMPDAEVTCEDDSDSWVEDDFEEILITKSIEVFKNLGHEVNISLTHGALECAFLKKLSPDIQVISLGPDINDVHSINETMSLDSLTLMKSVIFRVIESTA